MGTLKCGKKDTYCETKDTQCPKWTVEEFAVTVNVYINSMNVFTSRLRRGRIQKPNRATAGSHVCGWFGGT